MGTTWRVTVWDTLDGRVWQDLQTEVVTATEAFEAQYSRFRRDSLVWTLASATGTQSVPADYVAMLRLYEPLYAATDRRFTPLIATNLREAGYDEDYRLTPREAPLSPVPPLPEVLTVIDDTHVAFRSPCLLDFGGIGKGYFVDRLGQLLARRGLARYLIDGSGDLLYRGPGAVRIGLQHPTDPTQAIGTVDLTEGALCGSGMQRRQWAGYHHIIDPHTHRSPDRIAASWVRAAKAAWADGLATCLFLCPPAQLKTVPWAFTHCTVSTDLHVDADPDFGATLFTSSPQP